MNVWRLGFESVLEVWEGDLRIGCRVLGRRGVVVR